jgi:hypothetical protein
MLETLARLVWAEFITRNAMGILTSDCTSKKMTENRYGFYPGDLTDDLAVNTAQFFLLIEVFINVKSHLDMFICPSSPTNKQPPCPPAWAVF